MNAPENKDVLWVKTSAVLDGGAKVDGFIDYLWYSKAEQAVNRWVNGTFGTLDLMGSDRWIRWQLVDATFLVILYGAIDRRVLSGWQGLTELVGGQRGCVFGERSMDLVEVLARMECLELPAS